MTQGSRLHFAPPIPGAPADKVQTRGRVIPMPGTVLNFVSRRQSRHIAVTVLGACRGLLAAVMMPGIMTS